jgi:fructose 1,6-bisphosphatase
MDGALGTISMSAVRLLVGSTCGHTHTQQEVSSRLPAAVQQAVQHAVQELYWRLCSTEKNG